MNDERAHILRMLAEGKITAQDAETLLDALQTAPYPQLTDSAGAERATGPHKNPKYL